jgi:hypothetical protein
MSRTVRGLRSQSESITRYCGCVSPIASSTGRYTAITLRFAAARAKQT